MQTHFLMKKLNINNIGMEKSSIVLSEEKSTPTLIQKESDFTITQLIAEVFHELIPRLVFLFIVLSGFHLLLYYVPKLLSPYYTSKLSDCESPYTQTVSNLKTLNNTQLISYITTGKFIDLNEPKHKVHNKHGYISVTTKTSAYHYALPKDNKSRTFVSAVFVINQGKESTFKQVLCSIESGKTNYSFPLLKNNMATCGNNTKERWNDDKDIQS